MKMLIRMLRKEAGQALPIALILLFVGVLIIIPVLNLSTTNLKATQESDQRNRDIYAADAGIDDGLWKVGHNDLPQSMLGDWGENAYGQDAFSYEMYDDANPADTVAVNERNVDVSIKPLWVLEGLETPSSLQGNPENGYGRTPDDRLLTYGTLINNGVYQIVIFYDGSLGDLLITRIGCWLPPGFDYDWGSSNLEQGTGQPYHCIPQGVSYNGGYKLTWDFAGINYDDLPAAGNRRVVTFGFTPTSDNPVDAFSWTRSNNPTIKLSWDCSKKVYEIESAAPASSDNQTTIIAHSVRREFQPLGGAISGDYQATGMTVMRDHNNDSGNSRERLYNKTSASIKSKTEDTENGIPDDATVERIFLYWSGWKCKPWDAWDLTDTQLNALPEEKGVNKVALQVKVGETTMPSTIITASDRQTMRNGTDHDQHGWSYACFADITDVVSSYFKNQGVPFYGYGQYTVGHWDLSTTYTSTYRYWLYDWKDSHSQETHNYYTRYPLGSPRNGGMTDFIGRDRWGNDYYEDTSSEDQWSYSAWSVVVIYTSPSSAGHHLYIFDQFLYCDHYQELDFTIKGFLAPQDVQTSPNAARLTCFVGEGDSIYPNHTYPQPDSLYINNVPMSDEYNPVNNVWNSCSNVLGGTPTDNGIDIDTFSVAYPVIKPGDTEAEVDIPTGIDVWNLIYIILSFRSEITTGGTIDYTIK
jgi:hypothetical protein